MVLLSAQGAFEALLNLMVVPAVLMICLGIYHWYNGNQTGMENKSRRGRMLLMFGVILLVIVLVLTLFIIEYKIMRPGAV